MGCVCECSSEVNGENLSLQLDHLQLLVVPLPDLLRCLALHLSHACGF